MVPVPRPQPHCSAMASAMPMYITNDPRELTCDQPPHRYFRILGRSQKPIMCPTTAAQPTAPTSMSPNQMFPSVSARSVDIYDLLLSSPPQSPRSHRGLSVVDCEKGGGLGAFVIRIAHDLIGRGRRFVPELADEVCSALFCSHAQVQVSPNSHIEIVAIEIAKGREVSMASFSGEIVSPAGPP